MGRPKKSISNHIGETIEAARLDREWEYLVLALLDRATPETLNEFGAQGWELVTVVNFTCYLKRQRPA